MVDQQSLALLVGLGALTEAERYVISRRYWGDLSQSEVAVERGTTKSAIQHLERSALNKLRRKLERFREAA